MLFRLLSAVLLFHLVGLSVHERVLVLLVVDGEGLAELVPHLQVKVLQLTSRRIRPINCVVMLFVTGFFKGQTDEKLNFNG